MIIERGTVKLTASDEDEKITLTITATRREWRTVQSVLNDDGKVTTQNFWEVLHEYFGDSE